MSEKIICKNRDANFEFILLEKFEAGLVLVGSEVKSLREGKANINDSYVVHKNGELWLINSHISEYTAANQFNHEPERDRKLLLHKREIIKLIVKLKEKGLTVIPTKLYFKEGRAKAEIALAKGKKLFDKRRAIKERESKRQLAKVHKYRG